MLISTALGIAIKTINNRFQSLDWVDVDFDIVTIDKQFVPAVVSIPRLG